MKKTEQLRGGGGRGGLKQQCSSGAIWWSSKYGGIDIMGVIYSGILISGCAKEQHNYIVISWNRNRETYHPDHRAKLLS